MILQKWIHNEHWLQMMDILSLLSLSENVNLWADISLSNFWKLSLNIVGKSSEFLNVDRFTSLNVVSDVLDESFPDDDVLSFWLKRFQISSSSLSRIVVLSWVLVSVFKNPIRYKKAISIKFINVSNS